jgi:hypothetical protein
MKIINLVINLGENELSKWDLEDIKFNPDVFIYAYSTGEYDGSGMAVWRKDKEWSYHGLAHCSCYGPTENIEASNNMKLTFKQLIDLLETNYSSEYDKEAILVKEYLKKHYK